MRQSKKNYSVAKHTVVMCLSLTALLLSASVLIDCHQKGNRWFKGSLRHI